jgi:hypothetical protein
MQFPFHKENGFFEKEKPENEKFKNIVLFFLFK